MGEELPDSECLELQQSLGDEEDVDLGTESALESFTKFLVDAQAAAQEAERRREQEGGRKRKRGHYTGKSKQTQWRNKKAAESLKSKGFLKLRDFLKRKAPQGVDGGSAESVAAPDETEAQEIDSNESDGPVSLPISHFKTYLLYSTSKVLMRSPRKLHLPTKLAWIP